MVLELSKISERRNTKEHNLIHLAIVHQQIWQGKRRGMEVTEQETKAKGFTNTAAAQGVLVCLCAHKTCSPFLHGSALGLRHKFSLHSPPLPTTQSPLPLLSHSTSHLPWISNCLYSFQDFSDIYFHKILSA